MTLIPQLIAVVAHLTLVKHQLFSGSLNSEMRRRQSTSDYLTPLSTAGLDRPKLNRDASSGTSPMRERFGTLLGARRRDSGGKSDSIHTRLMSYLTAVSPRSTYTRNSAKTFGLWPSTAAYIAQGCCPTTSERKEWVRFRRNLGWW